jgi:hypothetical protein
VDVAVHSFAFSVCGGGGRMSKRAVWVAVMLVFLLRAAIAAEVEGIRIEDNIILPGGPSLVLNGAGVRTRFLFRIYVGALYLQQKKSEPDAVISDPGARRIMLHMLREISSEQLFSALNDGLKKNHLPEQLVRLLRFP